MPITVQSEVRRNLARSLVQRDIFCSITGRVLDERTCTVVVDNDGNPAAVFDPEVGTALRAHEEATGRTGLRAGMTILPGQGIDQFEEER